MLNILRRSLLKTLNIFHAPSTTSYGELSGLSKDIIQLQNLKVQWRYWSSIFSMARATMHKISSFVNWQHQAQTSLDWSSMLHGSCASSIFTLQSTISPLHETILSFSRRSICLLMPFTLTLQRSRYVFTMHTIKASLSLFQVIMCPMLSLVFIHWQAILVPLFKPTQKALLLKGLGSALVL